MCQYRFVQVVLPTKADSACFFSANSSSLQLDNNLVKVLVAAATIIARCSNVSVTVASIILDWIFDDGYLDD